MICSKENPLENILSARHFLTYFGQKSFQLISSSFNLLRESKISFIVCALAGLISFPNLTTITFPHLALLDWFFFHFVQTK